MTGTASDDHSRRVEAAYSWAASLIALARDLIAVGADVDLAPIRPAVRDLCDLLKSLPKDDAAIWLVRLVELQHELASLGRALANRERRGGGLREIFRRTRRMTTTSYVQFVLALLFVLALIGVAAIVARRLGLGHAARPAGRRRRLSVEEVLPLDGKRRLVLLRRDATEHLVILGPASETVIERGIARDDTFGAALREQAGAPPYAETPR